MKPQLIYYKVFTPRHKFVIEKHETKRLMRWIDRMTCDDSVIVVRCMLVEVGYNRYLYHYVKVVF